MDKEIKIKCKAAGTLDINDLEFFQGDLKTLSKENYERLRSRILQRGFSFPFFVWVENGTNWILDGHHRYLILQDLRAEGYHVPPLPVAYIEADTLQEAKAKLLELNSNYAKIDADGFLTFTVDLDMDEISLNIDLPDFEIPSIELEPEEKENEDSVPELKDDPITKRGDVWILGGKHRVMCGDSTMIDDVEKLMNGENFSLMISDLPYGVSYADKNNFLNSIDKGNNNQAEIKNDHITSEQLYDFAKSLYVNLVMFANKINSYYAFMPQGGDQMMMMMALKDAGFLVKHELIWLKNNHVLGRTDYAYKHEPICYGWKNKTTHKYYGDFQTSIFEFNKPNSSKLHPTMKPIELIERLILNSSNKKEIVIDPTIGSGSTLIACEKTKRKCYGMELDEHYCDVIINRFMDYAETDDVVLESSGQKYNELKKEND